MNDQKSRRRWRFTGDGPWSYEASQRARETVVDRIDRNMQNFHAAMARGDTEATAQCWALHRGYTAALTEVIERDVAAQKRLSWEYNQQAQLGVYTGFRYRYGSEVLLAARHGTLAPDWRDQLRAEHPHDEFPIPVMRDASTAAVDDLVALAVQPWEPHAAGGDWRAALDAWYRDSIALQDWRHQQEANRGVRTTRFYRPEDAERHEQSEADAAQQLAQSLANTRARIEASYQAGLAAGGGEAALILPDQVLPDYWRLPGSQH